MYINFQRNQVKTHVVTVPTIDIKVPRKEIIDTDGRHDGQTDGRTDKRTRANGHAQTDGRTSRVTT